METMDKLLERLYAERFEGAPQEWKGRLFWRDQPGRTIEDKHGNIYFIKDGGETVFVEPIWETVQRKPYCFECKFEIKYKNIDGKEIPYCYFCEGEHKNE